MDVRPSRQSVMIWEARFSGSHRNRNWESRTSILWLLKLSLNRINILTSKPRYSFQWPLHSIMASVTTVKSTPLHYYSWYCWIYSITLSVLSNSLSNVVIRINTNWIGTDTLSWIKESFSQVLLLFENIKMLAQQFSVSTDV